MTLQCKLRRHAVGLLRLSTFVAKVTGRRVRIPHRWVTAVTNRSWLLSTDGIHWVPAKIGPDGRVLS